MEDLETAVRLAPYHPDSRAALAVYYCDLGGDGDAEKSVARSLEIRRTYAALSVLGYLRFRQRRYQESASAFGEAARLPQRDSLVFAGLGEALAQTGDAAGARAAWEQAARLARDQLRRNPKEAQTRARLAFCLGRPGRLGQARREIAPALKAEPGNRAVLLRAASIAMMSRDQAAAIQHLEAAAKSGEDPRLIFAEPDFEPLARDERVQARLQSAFETHKRR